MKNRKIDLTKALLLNWILVFIASSLYCQNIRSVKLMIWGSNKHHLEVNYYSFEPASAINTVDANDKKDIILKIEDKITYAPNIAAVRTITCTNAYDLKNIQYTITGQSITRKLHFTKNDNLNKLFTENLVLPPLINSQLISIAEIVPIQNLKGIRRKFIQLRKEYNNAQHIYVYLNIAPSISYRRITVESAQISNYDSINVRNNEKKKTNFIGSNSFGFGYSFYNGHSLFASFFNEKMGYKIKDTIQVNKHYQGVWFGYRFQRLHQFNMVQPVFDLAYGFNFNNSYDKIKIGLGLSFMCTKNIYINVVPQYLQNFKSEERYTSSNLSTHLYNFGCDVGLTYKIFTP